MAVAGRLLVHWSCLLAGRVRPCVAGENVVRVTMSACGPPSRWDDVIWVPGDKCSSSGYVVTCVFERVHFHCIVKVL